MRMAGSRFSSLIIFLFSFSSLHSSFRYWNYWPFLFFIDAGTTITSLKTHLDERTKETKMKRKRNCSEYLRISWCRSAISNVYWPYLKRAYFNLNEEKIIIVCSSFIFSFWKTKMESTFFCNDIHSMDLQLILISYASFMRMYSAPSAFSISLHCLFHSYSLKLSRVNTNKSYQLDCTKCRIECIFRRHQTLNRTIMIFRIQYTKNPLHRFVVQHSETQLYLSNYILM